MSRGRKLWEAIVARRIHIDLVLLSSFLRKEDSNTKSMPIPRKAMSSKVPTMITNSRWLCRPMVLLIHLRGISWKKGVERAYLGVGPNCKWMAPTVGLRPIKTYLRIIRNYSSIPPHQNSQIRNYLDETKMLKYSMRRLTSFWPRFQRLFSSLKSMLSFLLQHARASKLYHPKISQIDMQSQQTVQNLLKIGLGFQTTLPWTQEKWSFKYSKPRSIQKQFETSLGYVFGQNLEFLCQTGSGFQTTLPWTQEKWTLKN